MLGSRDVVELVFGGRTGATILCSRVSGVNNKSFYSTEFLKQVRGSGPNLRHLKRPRAPEIMAVKTIPGVPALLPAIRRRSRPYCVATGSCGHPGAPLICSR